MAKFKIKNPLFVYVCAFFCDSLTLAPLHYSHVTLPHFHTSRVEGCVTFMYRSKCKSDGMTGAILEEWISLPPHVFALCIIHLPGPVNQTILPTADICSVLSHSACVEVDYNENYGSKNTESKEGKKTTH